MSRNAHTKLYSAILWLAILLMLVASVHRLTNEFDRLLFDQSFHGATDLKFRHADVRNWFRGLPVYQDKDAIYPPASYLMLWPFLGWLSVESARWLWTLSTIVMGIWLILLLVRESGANTWTERVCAFLLVPSLYSTGATIGNGQLIIHLLPPLITAIVLLKREPSWYRDLLVSLLFLISLAKPAIAAPFFWMVLFCGGGIRSGVLVGAGYAALTWIAMIPQNTDFPGVFSEWLARGSAAAVRGGYANIHSWLSALQLQAWILPASLLLFAALGLWIYHHRKANLWILLGITAYFSRFWIYHRLYDDLLVVIPMVTLFQITQRERNTNVGFAAGVILILNWMAALAPARFLSFPQPWSLLFEILQTASWMIGWIFLLYMAHKARSVDGGSA